ncbi:unnamed protein product [Allacma fusca]|uniref:Uncharacterized protein n=1 Tax=Allacma fusca TaxID=39272 RepID=A0A8J2P3R2_9HEXA|nr:unnamed protein product [Allacma fusca]
MLSSSTKYYGIIVVPSDVCLFETTSNSYDSVSVNMSSPPWITLVVSMSEVGPLTRMSNALSVLGLQLQLYAPLQEPALGFPQMFLRFRNRLTTLSRTSS